MRSRKLSDVTRANDVVQIDRVPGVDTIVGESPVWDPRTHSLWFIDRPDSRIYRLSAEDTLESWPAPEHPAAVAMMTDGRVAVTLLTGFRVLDPATGEWGPHTTGGVSLAERISEGKVDRAGRVLAASGDRGFTDPIGHLLRLEADGSTTMLRGGIHMANGLCVSVDGSTLYVADSLTRVLYAHDYREDGLSNERVIFSTAGEVCFPDGATVDADDCIWVALLHSPYIVRLAPDGRVLHRLEMPTPNITSLAFGGPDLDVLYVTSVHPERFPAAPPGAPEFPGAEGGHLYRVMGLGVRGVAETPVAPWATAG